MSVITTFIMKCGMIRLAKNIHVSVFSFFALAFFVMGQGFCYSAVFLSAILIHELSHIYFLYLFKARIKRITVCPFGIDICADTLYLSYKKELVCTLAGSFANFCAALLAFALFMAAKHPAVLFFIICNLFLGSMNLIPLPFFDGGKAARLIIYDKCDVDTAFAVYRKFELISAAVFFFYSIFLIKDSYFNLSVIMVIFYASSASLLKITLKAKKRRSDASL